MRSEPQQSSITASEGETAIAAAWPVEDVAAAALGHNARELATLDDEEESKDRHPIFFGSISTTPQQRVTRGSRPVLLRGRESPPMTTAAAGMSPADQLNDIVARENAYEALPDSRPGTAASTGTLDFETSSRPGTRSGTHVLVSATAQAVKLDEHLRGKLEGAVSMRYGREASTAKPLSYTSPPAAAASLILSPPTHSPPLSPHEVVDIGRHGIPWSHHELTEPP